MKTPISSFFRHPLLLIAIFCIAHLNLLAQDTVQVGLNGTLSSTNFGPIYRVTSGSNAFYCRYGYKYTASEMATAGITPGKALSAIFFFKNTPYQLTGSSSAIFKIYAKNTIGTVESSTSWATLISGATLVSVITFSSTNNLPNVTDWVSFPFATPFVYTGGAVDIYVDWALTSGTNPYTTGAFNWLYSTYTTNLTIGAVPSTLPLNDSTLLGSLSGNGGFSGNLRPNTKFAFVQNSGCSNIPNPGNTTTSAVTTCPDVPVYLGLQNTTYESGVSYQWYNTFGVIPGATQSLFTTIITSNETFYCGVTCGGQTVFSAPISITLLPYLTCYCASGANTTANEDIVNVTIGTRSNSSTCTTSTTGATYTDFTGLPPIALNQSQTVPVSIQISECFFQTFNNFVSIWIDYNHNGIFSLNEKVYSTNHAGVPYYLGNHTETGSFTVPQTALPGLTRMRVVCQQYNNGFAIVDPCLIYGSGETEDYLVDIVPVQDTLSLTCFIEGYTSGAVMAPVLLNQGQTVSLGVCDSITVELHSSTAPFELVSETKTVLNLSGQAMCIFPELSNTYYIVIKHRNGLETWSATPVSFATSSVVYNFSTSLAQAYGNNQIEVSPGIWALYSGDIVKDQNIDLLDLSILESDINNFSFGYLVTDLNGDGNVDLLDVPVLENNVSNFIFSTHP